jgi:molecular chaperone DnaJ
MMKDFYEVLGVPSDASQEDIKAVYRKKMLEYHPDRNPSEEAQEKAKSINEAFSVIGDPEKRKQYDFQRSGRGHGGFPGFDFNMGGPGNFDSIFEQFMGRRHQPRRGGNIQTKIGISLYESIFGTKKEIEYSYRIACQNCKETCSNCGGTGRFSNRQGHMMVTAPCSACGGSGSRNTGCDECSAGVKLVNRKVTVTVPPGVKDGSKLGLAGAGFPGENNMPPGDLIVHLEVVMPRSENFTEEQKEQLKSILGE